MDSPTASIIIPTRNRPQALEHCLDALASQTMPSGSFEVIVVDDGSEPVLCLESGRWASKFVLKLIHQKNTGPGGARNRGVAEALGEFLAFTDDDCLPTPTWLEKLVAALRENPEVMVGGSTFNGMKNDLFAETSQLILEMVYEHFNRDPENAYFFASNNMAMRRSKFIELNGFDNSFYEASEDREFCDRWRLENHSLRWIPSATLEHHHHQNFIKFTELHLRYGRGARRYKRLREARKSGDMALDLDFHHRVPGLAWSKRKKFKPITFIKVAVLLIYWEAINSTGFLFSNIASKRFSFM